MSTKRVVLTFASGAIILLVVVGLNVMSGISSSRFSATFAATTVPGTPLPPNYDMLLAKVRQAGTIRVVVEFRTAGSSTASPSTPEDLRAEDVAIQQARAQLLAQLAPYHVTLISGDWFIPYVALKVDESALLSLMNAPQVLGIIEDVSFPVAR